MTRARGRAPILLLLVSAVPAGAADTRFSADLGAGVGYSRNPYSTVGGGGGTGFYDLSAAARVNIVDELSTLTAEARANLQDYFNDLPSSDAWGAGLTYNRRLTERLSGNVRLDYDNSVLGANNAGFGFVDPVLPDPTVPGPVVPNPTVPFPTLPDGADIGLFGTRARREVITAGGGLSYTIGAYDSVQAGGSYSRASYGRDVPGGDYQSYEGSLGYQRRLSAALTVGVTGSYSRYDYELDNRSTSVKTVQGTVGWQINERWSLNGGLGVSFIGASSTGPSRSTVSGSGTLCRRGELDNMCLQASRQVAPTGFAGVQETTVVALSYDRRLSERDSISGSLSYSSNAGDNVLVGSSSRFYAANVGYNRVLTQRLRLTSSLFYRKVDGGAVDISGDYGGRIGLAYRLGDTR